MRDGSATSVAFTAEPARPEAVTRPAAFVTLFQTHADFVFRVLKRLGVPDAEVEDALQEVFMVVARRLDSYEERGTMRAWLVAIARQVAQHVRRSNQRRERRLHLQTVPRVVPDPHQLAERNQAANLVREFLASLESQQAMVFYLAEIEGMTAPEIAAALRANLNTVYARLRLARKRFEELLRQRANREW